MSKVNGTNMRKKGQNDYLEERRRNTYTTCV